jgi:manganese/zinc/iron transport system permease protein
MIREAMDILSGWSSLDSWIVVTAALAAMACAVPGVFLVIRRQSMMGDALSHTTLPGVVIAFLLAHWLRTSGWLSEEAYDASRHGVMFAGALIIGIVSAGLTEAVQKLGKVEASAALGVVFTSLFAVGLLLIRIAADSVHLDPDCVLYGIVETVVLDTIGSTGIPRAAVTSLAVLVANLVLVVLFFKELRLSAFDGALATTLGINAQAMHYGLMAITAATLVSAFETVGSILVIAMLIAPAATSHLLTDRLSVMIGLSLFFAAAAAVLGHGMAITIPPILFSRLGFPTVGDASVAGMIAVASGLLFFGAMLFGPRYGIFSRITHQTRLGLRIAAEDVLGLLYRAEEQPGRAAAQPIMSPAVGRWLTSLALRRLAWSGAIIPTSDGYQLTDSGRARAEQLVRAHRLWESYMAKHFELPEDHLHDTAARVEHYLDPALRARLADELETPDMDPHGRAIPGEEQ